MPDEGIESLFGSLDENLRSLEAALRVTIKTSGHDLMLEGDQGDVARAERALSQLADLLRGGYRFARGDVKTAAQLINRYGPLESFPADALNEENRVLALLFKDLATLRTNAPLFDDVDELRWHGTTPEFAAVAEKIESARLLTRVRKQEKRLKAGNK